MLPQGLERVEYIQVVSGQIFSISYASLENTAQLPGETPDTNHDENCNILSSSSAVHTMIKAETSNTPAKSNRKTPFFCKN